MCSRAALCRLASVLDTEYWEQNPFTYLEVATYLRNVILEDVSFSGLDHYIRIHVEKLLREHTNGVTSFRQSAMPCQLFWDMNA